MRLNSILPGLTLVAAATGYGTAAFAQLEPAIEPRFGLRVGVEHSDNPARASEDADPESLTFGTAGLDVGLEREGPRLLVFLDGSMDYYKYDSDEIENETLADIAGGLQVRMIPDMLVWDLERTIGDVRRDPFRSDGPGNRERLTVTTTGPTLTVPLADRDSLRLALGHADREWDESDSLDSTSESGSIAWLRQLGARQQIGLTGSTQRIDYGIDSIPNYDIRAAYVTFQQTLPAGDLSVSVGSNRIEIAEQSDSGLYLDLSWERRLAAYSSIALTGGQRYEDASSQFRIRDADVGPGEAIGDLPASASPFVRSRVGFEYALDRSRLGFAFGSDLSEERYETLTTRDRDRARLSGSASYQFGESLTGRIGVFHLSEEYRIDATTQTERGVSVGVSQRLSATWDMEFRYLRRERDDDGGQAYEENRLILGFGWVPRR